MKNQNLNIAIYEPVVLLQKKNLNNDRKIFLSDVAEQFI